MLWGWRMGLSIWLVCVPEQTSFLFLPLGQLRRETDMKVIQNPERPCVPPG